MSEQRSGSSELDEVARLFLKLGLIAFGGPAAHIAMMREEVVRRRGWMDDQRFLDLLGATNLIPGPNSTEMAIHIGHERAGRRGLVVAGTLFILPAMLIVLALAWIYARYGTYPEAAAIMYGIKPVIIAIVVQALIALGRTAVKDVLTAGAVLAVLGLFLLGANELLLLLVVGLLVMLVRNLRRLRQGGSGPALALLSGMGVGPLVAAAAPAAPVTLLGLFLVFLKIGSVLYGSGYVLLAFLRSDLVNRLGWLTDQQLLDAIAIGQFTPGPVFTTATFIGYVVASWPDAILATVGIFLPSFIFVALSNPLIPHLRRSPWFGALLDGVNAGSLGLMAGVLLVRYKINSVWLVIGGAVVGFVLRVLLA